MDIRDIESGMDSTEGTVTSGELLYTAADMQATMEAGFREGFWGYTSEYLSSASSGIYDSGASTDLAVEGNTRTM